MRFEAGISPKVCPLSECVNASVGSARTVDHDPLPHHVGKGVLDRSLHRGKIGLTLPSEKRRAVVLNFKKDVFSDERLLLRFRVQLILRYL